MESKNPAVNNPGGVPSNGTAEVPVSLGKKVLSIPGKIFKYAGKGIMYLFTSFSPDNTALEMDRLTGQELSEELQKVQQSSNDYTKKAAEEEELKKKIAEGLNLVSFRYVVRDSSGKLVKSTFEAPSINDVRTFLTNEGYEIISIQERSKFDIDVSFGTYKVKNGDLSFLLTQLSTYLKAGIPLIQSVRILAKQTEDQALRKTLNRVVYELVYGEKFSIALEKQNGAFPRLLINMVKTSEMTGDLSGTLDEMAAYYTQTEAARKAMVSALVYPLAILSVAVIAVVFIIVYVVPQFIDMFASNNAELPGITLFIIAASDFLSSYWWAIILVIVVVLVTYFWCFKNLRTFRKAMQTFYMKLPVIGNIIIFNEVTTFTRTFSSLINHNVFITDSMDILSKISTNEIYREIINRTMIGLSKGSKISETFKGEWAFPVVAYEMLVTGESTGQLGVMMEKVADHYQNLHANLITTLKSLLEPIIICFLAVAVGFIIMAVILPMFDLYGQI